MDKISLFLFYGHFIIMAFVFAGKVYKPTESGYARPAITYVQANIRFADIVRGTNAPYPKPQRPPPPSQNVPAPTRRQWAQIHSYLRKNGWRTAPWHLEAMKLEAAGWQHKGGKRAFRSLWVQVHEPLPVYKRVKIEPMTTRPAQPTAGKAVKVRSVRKTYASDTAQAGVFVAKTISRLPRCQIITLLARLRTIIRALVIKRSTYTRAERLRAYVSPCGEAQGLFDIKIAPSKESLDAITTSLQNMVDKVIGKSQDLRDNTIKLATTVGGILATAAAGNSLRSWVVGSLSILVNLGVLLPERMTRIAESMLDARSSEPIDQTVCAGHAQGPITEQEEIGLRGVTALWQSIAVFIGVKNEITRKPNANLMEWTASMMKEVRLAATGTNGFLAMFKNMWEIIRAMFHWCIRKFSKTTDDILKIWEKSPAITALIQECDALLTVSQSTFIKQEYMARLVTANAVVTNFITSIMTSDVRDRTLVQYLISIQARLQRLVTDCRKAGYGAFTRPTPFVVYIEGAPKMGKSELVSRLAFELLKEARIPFTAAQPIYFKPSSAEHWDAYNCEPVIVFDDFEQVKHSSTEKCDAACLLLLKSSAVFRPPMASLADKGRIAAPDIVIICSNTSHPINPAITTPEALWRRRDVMYNVRFADGCNSVPSAVDPSFSYLRFAQYKEVSKADSKELEVAQPFDHMLASLKRQFLEYREKENQLVILREKPFREYLEAVNANETVAPLTIGKLREMCQAYDDGVAAMKDMSPETKHYWFHRVKETISDVTQSWFKYLNVKDKSTINLTDQIIEANAEADANMDSCFTAIIQDTPLEHLIEKEYFLGVQEVFQRRIHAHLKKLGYDKDFDFFKSTISQGTTIEVLLPHSSKHNNSGVAQTILTGLPADNIEVEIGFHDDDALSQDSETNVVKAKELSNVTQQIEAFDKDIQHRHDIPYMLRQISATRYPNFLKIAMTKIFLKDIKNCQHVHSDLTNIEFLEHNPLMVRTPFFKLGAMTSESKLVPLYPCHETNCMLQHSLGWDFVRSHFKLFSQAAIALDKRRRVDPTKRTGSDTLWLPLIEKHPKINSNTPWISPKLKEYWQRILNGAKVRVSTGVKIFWTICKWIVIIAIPLLGALAIFSGVRGAKTLPEETKEVLSEIPVHKRYLNHNYINHCKTQLKQDYLDGLHSLKLYKDRVLSRSQPSAPEMADDLDFEGGSYVPTEMRPKLSLPSLVRGTAESAEFQRLNIEHFKNATVFLLVSGTDKNTEEPVYAPFRGFRLYSRWIVIPKHYIYQIHKLDPKTAWCDVKTSKKQFSVNPFSFEIKRFVDSEMCAIRLPTIDESKDFRKNFLYDREWRGLPLARDATIIEVDPNFNVVAHRIKCSIAKSFDLLVDENVSSKLDVVVRYNYSGKGRCMSVLVDSNGYIRGFHIAGTSIYGFAEPVVRESLESLPPVPKFATTLKEVASATPEGPAQVSITTDVHHVGIVDRKHAVLPADTSVIKPSIIHGIFPVRTVPGPLRRCKENNFTDPLAEGVNKHGMPCLGFSNVAYQVGYRRLKTLILNHVKPKFNTDDVLSETMAVCGIPSTACFKRIVMSTSEGYPYVLYRPPRALGKSWLLNPDDPDAVVIHPMLRERLDTTLELRKQGIVVDTVFMDCLKDARLPIEKAYIPGKVRVFSVAPTDYIIHYRQYFGNFIMSYVDSRFETCHAVGITPESVEWTSLVQYLTTVGTKFLAGDYSNFGPGFDKRSHEITNQVMRDWYKLNFNSSDQDQLVRRMLHYEVEYPLHLARNVLYRTIAGMPSGSPITTITNSLVNTLYIIMAWFEIFRSLNPEYITFDFMRRNIKFVTFGDDILMCISNEVSEIFNNITLQNFFSKLNIKYTNSTKTSDMVPWQPLSEVTFLKREFIPHPIYKLYLAGVDIVSIEDCANWIHKSPCPYFASREGSLACLLLAYTRGPTYFQTVYDKLISIWRELDYPIFPRTWAEIDYMYLGHCFESEFSGIAQGPGDDVSAPVDNTSCVQQQDTILQESEPPLSTCETPLIRKIEDWCGVDHDESYERLFNRELLVGQYNWSSVRDKNEFLLDSSSRSSKLNLPYVVIKEHSNTPSALALLQFRYGRFDMKVRIQVNANPFMCGQLQASWYYGHQYDAGYESYRDHVAARSSMLNTILDAGQNNSAELCIPYKNYRPWVHLASRSDMGPQCSLGELQIRVLSKLTASSQTYNTCSVSVFLSLHNVKLMGLVSRDLNKVSASGEMMAFAATLAAKYLTDKYADPNRDKPPVTLLPPTMIPQTTGSLAVGTGTPEPITPLRLDSRGMVPHPDGIDHVTTFTEIASHKGLIKSISWAATKARGDLLGSIPGVPYVPPEVVQRKFSSDLYYSLTIDADREVSGFYLPPVAVVSQLFSFWRGSLIFEFHVVGSQYHTGRIMCAYIPHHIGDVTMEQAQAGPYVTFDIGSQRTFTFVTPYLADQPWWPCMSMNGNSPNIEKVPGTIRLYVLNPLIPMDTIANTLEILVYIRAHSSFEIAVPCQSSVVLPWNARILDTSFYYARPGYAPWYPGVWRFFWNSNRAVLRYGPGSDHIAQFSSLSYGDAGANGGWYYWCIDASEKATREIEMELKHHNSQSRKYTYGDLAFVPLDVDDGYGAIYMAVFALSDLMEDATTKKFSEHCPYKEKYEKGDKKKFPTPSYTGALIPTDKGGDYSVGNPKLMRYLFPNSNFPTKVRTLQSMELSGESEGDFRLTDMGLACAPQPTVISTGCGMDTFGESYNSIKDYLRRYALYGHVQVNIPTFSGYHAAGFIPILPQGYYNPFTPDDEGRYTRDPGQSLIASGFRFFRGSWNVKLTTPSVNAIIWVQHRPDRYLETNMLFSGSKTLIDSHFLQNYGTTVQSGTNAPMVTVNVPFYQPGSLGLLQFPDLKSALHIRRAMSLGELVFGVYSTSTTVQQGIVHAYMAAGDDMQFLSFCGFPVLVPLVSILKTTK